MSSSPLRGCYHFQLFIFISWQGVAPIGRHQINFGVEIKPTDPTVKHEPTDGAIEPTKVGKGEYEYNNEIKIGIYFSN